jgi:hypothetical protein
MNTSNQRRLARAAIAVAALSSMAARGVAAGGFELSLLQYEFTFGQGRTEHAFSLSNFAPGDRFGEFAFGENGRIRIPVYSTDPKARALFRNSDSTAPPPSGEQIIAGLLGLVTIGLMVAAMADTASDTAEAIKPDPIVDLSGFDPRSSATTSTTTAKK